MPVKAPAALRQDDWLMRLPKLCADVWKLWQHLEERTDGKNQLKELQEAVKVDVKAEVLYFSSILVQFCLWKFESKRFWCRFKERCIEGWAEGGTDREGKKGNNWCGLIRSTAFSATLHNPVMLSPTSGCQKYPCRLPSEHLPSAASPGWDALSGVPPGNTGSYSSSTVTSALFQAPGHDSKLGPAVFPGSVTTCGWPLGARVPPNSTWHPTGEDSSTGHELSGSVDPGHLQAHAAIVTYQPSRSPDYQVVMALQFICTEQTLVIALVDSTLDCNNRHV